MPRRTRSSGPVLFGTAALLVLCSAAARALDYGPTAEVKPEHSGVLALNGEFVHNVGELQVNITNWGLIGSRPGQRANFSSAPSAMWPAGSGVEYLFAAGLWIGALRNGTPLVTTGQYQSEMRSSPDDPLDTIWRTHHGDEGGRRYPDPLEDDDRDGLVDEDPLNGYDDDQDGEIDEDFAAIGNQMFRAVMRDNLPLILEDQPEHEPLNLRIEQQSYAWEDDGADDFIGLDYTLTNIGNRPLLQVYVGFFADPDIGERARGAISLDDVPGWFKGAVRAADHTLVPITVGYAYDNDADGGAAPGWIGIMFLDHPIDPSGETAPERVGITSFNAFAGLAEFSRGGDPTNDAERYELLSTPTFDMPGTVAKANDFRILLATGPFQRIEPGETLNFAACIVVGLGESGLLQNAADAAQTYYGAHFDKDLDPSTGIEGRENKICAEDFGSSASNPANTIYTLFMNPCDTIGIADGGPLVPAIKETDLDEDGCVFVNSDCYFELERRSGRNDCYLEAYLPPEQLGGCTGVEGKEFPVRWLIGLAPVAPGMRLWEQDNRTHVFWNGLSEIVPDTRLQVIDFESYRIWRADGWDRPFGSSIENGPEATLWALIAEYDAVSFYYDRRTVEGQTVEHRLPLGANTGLDVVRYVPRMYREGTPEWESGAAARAFASQVLEDPEFDFLNATLDPADFMRYRKSNGLLTSVGAKYPQVRDFQGSYDSLDTAFWHETGMPFYEYVDKDVFNGQAYFYAVTATDFRAEAVGNQATPVGPGLSGDPQSNFGFAVPRFAAQTKEERAAEGQDIFVFPNPATREALAEFSQLSPNGHDPTGVRVMFANLPRSRNRINIYTLAGDLVQTIDHDGYALDCPTADGFGDCGGSAFWNLMSRSGQEVVSGIYLFSVESNDAAFDRVVGRFVVVR